MAQMHILGTILAGFILFIAVVSLILIMFRITDIPKFFLNNRDKHTKFKINEKRNKKAEEEITNYLTRNGYILKAIKGDNIWIKNPYNSGIYFYILTKLHNYYFIESWWRIDLPYLNKYDYPLNFPFIVSPSNNLKKDIKNIKTIISMRTK